MKRIFLTLIVIALLASCSSKENRPISTEIFGTWKWVKSTGGVSGTTETPESTGNQVILEISEETIKKYVNGVLESELSYFIVQGQSIWTPIVSNIIIYENDSRQSVELDGDNLTLYDECYDCFQNEYIRQ